VGYRGGRGRVKVELFRAVFVVRAGGETHWDKFPFRGRKCKAEGQLKLIKGAV